MKTIRTFMIKPLNGKGITSFYFNGLPFQNIKELFLLYWNELE